MDRCPTEILHGICALLEPEDIVSVRGASKGLADIGAHHLLSTIHFYGTKESLNRLKLISQHPIFSQHVDTLYWEAVTLSDAVTAEDLRQRPDFKVHTKSKPKAPPPNATQEKRRQFERKLASWASSPKALSKPMVKKQLGLWKKLISEEAEASDNELEEVTIASAIPLFPRLKSIHYDNEPKCKCQHHFSGRFQDRFKNIVFPPVFAHDSGPSIWQVRRLLLSVADRGLALDRLCVSSIAPDFFMWWESTQSTGKLHNAVRSLKHLNLRFRLDEDHEHFDDRGCYSILYKGGLKDMLAAAPGLECLKISFGDYPKDPAVDVESVLGQTVWPNLTSLALCHMISTSDLLMGSLLRQTALTDLSLGFMTVTIGSWEKTAERMQTDLSLQHATFWGLLFGSDPTHPEFWDTEAVNMLPDPSETDFSDEEGYEDYMAMRREEGERVELASELSKYVTAGDKDDPNPFYSHEWMEADMA